MPVRCRLEAIHRPNETLRDHLPQRRDVEIGMDCNAESSVCLGRNSTTQVAHPSIHRRTCYVYWTSTNHLFVRGAKSESIYYINGDPVEGNQARELTAGDMVALGKNEQGTEYEYRVVMDSGTPAPAAARLSQLLVNNMNNSPPGSARKRRAMDPVVESSAPDAAAASSTPAPTNVAAEECQCAMCLEIQVQSTTLVPCGHTFCRECVQNAKECPTCRSQIQTNVACRALDNVIGALIEADLFDDDDVQHYQERMAATASEASKTTVKSPSKRRNRAREVSASSTATIINNNNNSTGASTEDAICVD